MKLQLNTEGVKTVPLERLLVLLDGLVAKQDWLSRSLVEDSFINECESLRTMRRLADASAKVAIVRNELDRRDANRSHQHG